MTPPWPAERIIELNRPKGDVHTARGHRRNGRALEVPPVSHGFGVEVALHHDGDDGVLTCPFRCTAGRDGS